MRFLLQTEFSALQRGCALSLLKIPHVGCLWELALNLTNGQVRAERAAMESSSFATLTCSPSATKRECL